MSWHDPNDGGSNDPGGRRGYHHGHLREALIQAAIALIAEKGPSGFTFADAARAAGVSSAAPYRHFRDRDELMAEVAREGFLRFEAALARAWNGGKPDPFTAFTSLGRAYLEFARTQTAYYMAMFQAGIPSNLDPALRGAGDAAFAVLRAATEALTAQLPKDQRPPALMVSLHIWSLAHGVGTLFGHPAGRPIPMAPEELLEAAVLIYLRGLGLHAA